MTGGEKSAQCVAALGRLASPNPYWPPRAPPFMGVEAVAAAAAVSLTLGLVMACLGGLVAKNPAFHRASRRDWNSV